MHADVLISEVGPRDGLQSVQATMPTADKLRWIDALVAAGLREIEVGSFVPARLLPQMADVAGVVRHALTHPGITVMALVPNLRGAEAEVPIQILTDLESDAGEQISYDLLAELRMAPVEGEDILEGKEESQKFYTDTIYIDQARCGVNTGGRMTRKRTLHNLREKAKRQQSGLDRIGKGGTAQQAAQQAAQNKLDNDLRYDRLDEIAKANKTELDGLRSRLNSEAEALKDFRDANMVQEGEY